MAKDADGLAAALKAGTPSPISYNTEKPKALTDEDAVIATLPLALPAENVQVIDAETMFE